MADPSYYKSVVPSRTWAGAEIWDMSTRLGRDFSNVDKRLYLDSLQSQGQPTGNYAYDTSRRNNFGDGYQVNGGIPVPFSVLGRGAPFLQRIKVTAVGYPERGIAVSIYDKTVPGSGPVAQFSDAVGNPGYVSPGICLIDYPFVSGRYYWIEFGIRNFGSGDTYADQSWRIVVQPDGDFPNETDPNAPPPELPPYDPPPFDDWDDLPKPIPNLPDNRDLETPTDKKLKDTETKLEMIRRFSRDTKTAVRIISPSEIEVVNPNAPIASGWVNGQAERYFVSDTTEESVSDNVLKLGKGYAVITGSGRLHDDDDRVLSIRMPQRIPTPDGPPLPCVKVHWVATPDSFESDVAWYDPTAHLGG